MVWVGRDLSDHLVPTPCYRQGHLPLDSLPKAPSSLALNASREGASTASLISNNEVGDVFITFKKK